MIHVLSLIFENTLKVHHLNFVPRNFDAIGTILQLTSVSLSAYELCDFFGLTFY